MSHYDEVLKEARAKASGSAREYVPKLFHILVDEEERKPDEARAIIEHDLISYWAKTTVTKYLPQEAKDEIKVKAGKEGAKATNLVLAGGQTVTKTADDKIPADEPEEPTPLELAEIKIKHLEEALHKTQQFKPATALQEKPKLDLDTEVFKILRLSADGVHSFYYDTYGIELFRNRELSQLKNSGVKVFRRLYFEV